MQKKDISEKLIIDLSTERVHKKLDNVEKHAKIISFYAEKGGVGKSTLCINLAYTLAEQEKRVLIYDCDVQRSLTAWIFGNNIEVKSQNSVDKVDEFIESVENRMDKKTFALS